MLPRYLFLVCIFLSARNAPCELDYYYTDGPFREFRDNKRFIANCYWFMAQYGDYSSLNLIGLRRLVL